MNGIRCPKCDLVNLLSADSCARCAAQLSELPSTAQVSVPVDQMFQARQFAGSDRSGIPEDNELGRKTFFWYRVYCGAMVAIYVLTMGLGAVLIFSPPDPDSFSSAENTIAGSVYLVIGLVFAVVFAVALFLPRRSYNWIVGIVMMAIGMTSCCFVPAVLPLLIFWVRPETRAYFGRN